MRLSVRSQAKDAAWLMPTPSRARVTLGERDWFDQLDRLTEPAVIRHRHWLPHLEHQRSYGAAAPPGGGVGVLARQRLGPFEVTTLSAGDAKALAAWLTGHGYHLPGRLAEALEAVRRAAVDLHRDQACARPRPALRRARPAAHRLPGERAGLPDPAVPAREDPAGRAPVRARAAPGASVRAVRRWAGHDVRRPGRPTSVASPALRTMLGQGAFLTELVRQGIPPSAFTGDLRLGYTADTSYRQVETVDDGLVRFLGVPAFLWFVALAAVALALAVVIPVRRAARARRGTWRASP